MKRSQKYKQNQCDDSNSKYHKEENSTEVKDEEIFLSVKELRQQ